MRKSILMAVLAPVSLSACAASIPPVEVTRFHIAESFAPAPTRVEAASGMEGITYAAAVAREMTALGYAETPEDTAATYIAKTGFSRDTRVETKSSPFSIGVGSGIGGRHVGVGVGASIPLGGGTRQIIVTQLTVQLVRKADGQTVWEGRAETQAPANAPASQPGLAAAKLAKALFSGFPGRSGETIRVP